MTRLNSLENRYGRRSSFYSLSLSSLIVHLRHASSSRDVRRDITGYVTRDSGVTALGGVVGTIARTSAMCDLLMHGMCVSPWCECACHRKEAA